MNAAFLLMSSATLVGADPAPAHAPVPAAPVVISSGAGCSNCGTPAPAHYAYAGDCGCSKPGLLDRLKARFGKKSHDCGCAPAPVSCDPCATSASYRPNLFDTLKSRWGKKKSHGPCCDPCGAAHLSHGSVGGCAAPLPPDATPVTPNTGNAPKEMPKPKDPKEMPKVKDSKDKGGNSTSVPIPVPTVNGAGLIVPGSPY